MATLDDFKPLELEKNDEREKIGTSLDEFKLEETDKGQKTDFVRGLDQLGAISNKNFINQIELVKTIFTNDTSLASYVKLLDSFLTLQIPDDARSDIFGVLKNIENSEDNVYRLQLIEQLQAITSAYQGARLDTRDAESVAITELDEEIIVEGGEGVQANSDDTLSQTNIIPNEVFSDQVEATKLAIANDVVLSSYSKMIDNLLLMKVSVEVRKEMFSILEKIEQSSDNAERLELVQKLQVITSTQIVNNEGSTEVMQLENPEELIRKMLEANVSRLDGSTKRIDALLVESDLLTSDQLTAKLSGEGLENAGTLWNFLDVREGEWEGYFDDHQIPEEQQDQMRYYYSELMEDKNFGNLVWTDLGDKIGREAERINALGDDVTNITIHINALNPEGEPNEFEDKRGALLYLYHNKLLLREVPTLMGDIVAWATTAGEVGKKTLAFIWENIESFIAFAIGYIGVATLGTVLRKLNAFVIRKRYNQGFVPTLVTGGLNKLAVGEYLFKAASPLDSEESRESAELREREKYLEILEEKYKGNPKVIAQIGHAKKYIRVLDHNIDSGEEDEKKITSIIKEISERQAELEQTDAKLQPATAKRLKKEIKAFEKQKSEYSRKLFRFSESTFWREISYIEDGSWHKNRFIDTGKIWLSNTEGESIDRLNSSKRLFGEALKDFFDESGKIKGPLLEAHQYITRSHDIPNNIEKDVEKLFNEYVGQLKNGHFGDVLGTTKKQFIQAIKNKLLSEINSQTGLELSHNIFTNGSKLDNAKDLFFDGFDDFPTQRGTNKRQEWVKLIFQDSNIPDLQMKEIDKFFAEISKKGGNEYNQRTALDIVARILKKNLSYKDAIEESFKVSWEHVKNINVDSDFNGSLDSLIEKIDAGTYSLEVNEATKRSPVKTPVSGDGGGPSTSDETSDELPKETRKERKERKEEEKKAKEALKERLVELEKGKNIRSAVFDGDNIKIIITGYENSKYNTYVKREILLQPSELDNVIIALESKKDSEKLVLSDKSQLVNALTAIEGITIQDIQKNKLKNGKDALTQKYTDMANTIKDFSVRDKLSYLKDKFGGINEIPSFFTGKYENLKGYIDYNKYKEIFEDLERELIVRGRYEEADEIYAKLHEINANESALNILVEDNKRVKSLRDFYSGKFLNGEKFRSRVELDQLMEEITRIDFDTISESDFKLKIAQTFNIDSNFGVNSFEDIKKIFKRITR